MRFLLRPLFLIVRLSLLSLVFCSLLLIFSLSDIQWNTKYIFDVHPLPTVDALEIENAAKLMHLILYDISPYSDLSAALSELRNAPNELKNPHSSLQDQVIMANLAKVNEEIKQSSAYMNDQFNKKFILVGALLSFIVLFFKESISERLKTKATFNSVDFHFIDMCRTHIICTIVALAVIICVSIDIQDRTKINISNAHGAWIARYIEDPILNVNFNSKCKSDANRDGPRNGWESYLRLTQDDKCEDVSGFHHDDWGHLLFSVQNHYLTIVLYIIYILLLNFAFIQTKKSQLHNKIALVVLSIVQLSLLAFAIISRHSSGVFEVKVIPGGCWLSGWQVTGASLLLGLSPSVFLALYGMHCIVQRKLMLSRKSFTSGIPLIVP